MNISHKIHHHPPHTHKNPLALLELTNYCIAQLIIMHPNPSCPLSHHSSRDNFTRILQDPEHLHNLAINSVSNYQINPFEVDTVTTFLSFDSLSASNCLNDEHQSLCNQINESSPHLTMDSKQQSLKASAFFPPTIHISSAIRTPLNEARNYDNLSNIHPS
ncbi:hypothetical protein FGO68_gene8349 [Halteria grandinella]|uniref:Uncharacterized protein n=1 Tax=Halteria grandinella TaxID=5974 RepID=A0A8J8SUT0_HALGN|nr:hypothetical protein FGO68_gene8349 [Halteria grandinella]